jgi:hypothetical protein
MDQRIGRYSDGLNATTPTNARVGRFADGTATRARARVGRFADGTAALGAGPHEGRFSTGMERAARQPEPRHIRPRETAAPWRDAA